MSLSSFVKGKVLASFIGKVADSEPRTTVAGAALAGLIAAKIDYNKLVQGDPQQIGNAVAAVIVALIGYWTNNRNSRKSAASSTEPQK